MNDTEHDCCSHPTEQLILPMDEFGDQKMSEKSTLLQCLRELSGERTTFILLRETPLDERCINHGDVDLLGTTDAVEGLMARCYAWAKQGRCHFRVTRKKHGHVGLVLFSRNGQFRIHVDLWINLWQLNHGQLGLRFEDVTHLIPQDRSGIVRLPVPVEAAIYLHHFVVQRKSIEIETVRQRLSFYAAECRQAQSSEIAEDLDAVLQRGHVEEVALARAMRLLKSFNVTPSLITSWQVTRQRWIGRCRRWWLGTPHRPKVISFMGCDGAGKTSLSESFPSDTNSPVQLKPFVGRNLYRKSLFYRLIGSLIRSGLSINRDRFDEVFCLPLYLQASAHLRRKVYWRQLLGGRRLMVMDRTLADLLYTQRLSDNAKFGRWVRLADFFGIRLPTVHFIVDFEQLHARKAECSEIAHRHYDEDMFWFHSRRVPTDYTVFCNRGTKDESKAALSHVIEANWPHHRAA